MRGQQVFTPMVHVVPEGSSGHAAIDHFEIDKDLAMFSRLRDMINGTHTESVEPGRYARLRVNGGIVMTDTQMEQDTNREAVDEARGDVLIAGLGLGMVLLPILRKPGVMSVVVVEVDRDVIALVEDPIRRAARRDTRKLTVVHDDIFDWRPAPGQQFDTLYFDIWPNMSQDNLPHMAILRRKFARWRRPGAWVGCWFESALRAQKASGRWR